MKEEAIAILEQIHLLNKQFHEAQGCAELSSYCELMRASKNRCQLSLLKFFASDVVWIKKDLAQPNKEWLVGVYGQPDHFASHIPMSVLQQGLSTVQLAAWKIY